MTPAPQRETPGLWASIREALSGTHRDYTEGSIGRAVVLLAIPMVLEMCMESLFGVVDIFFVAHLGANAIATVGLTEAMLTVLFAVALGLSMAVTAVVARRTGEKNEHGAAIVAVQAIGVGVAVSAAVGIIGFFFGARLLGWMGAPAAVIETGSRYTRTILSGSVTIFLLFLINAVFRGAGDAATAMRALWIANAVNIALNPCLILGLGPFPRLGVTGSAVGTTVGRGTGVLYQLFVLSTGRSRIRVRASEVRLQVPVMLNLLRLSLGGTLQFLVQMASWIGMVRIVSTFGPPAVAGYTLAIRIIVFAILPSWGLSNAAATLVGQNLGAKKPERAEKSVWITGFYNMLFLGAVGVTFVLFADSLIGLFSKDPMVRPMAVSCLRYLSYGYLFYGYGMVMTQAFNGAGDTLTPTMLNLVAFWIFQLPMAYALAYPFGLATRGVFLAILFSESLLAVLAIATFRRGRWKTQVV